MGAIVQMSEHRLFPPYFMEFQICNIGVGIGGAASTQEDEFDS